MYRLSDKDFIVDIPADEIFDAAPVVRKSIVPELEEVGMIRCTCGKVLNAAPRIYQKIRQKIIDIKEKTGRYISDDEYAEVFSTAIKAEPSIRRACCKSIIQSTPRIIPLSGDAIIRPIEGDEQLLKRARTARDGNVIITRLDPRPYNPYAKNPDLIMVDEEAIDDDEEGEELKQLRLYGMRESDSEAENTDVEDDPELTGFELDNFPDMPPFTEKDKFEEEILDLYSGIEDEYIVYGIASTGVKGYEVPVIRARQHYGQVRRVTSAEREAFEKIKTVHANIGKSIRA